MKRKRFVIFILSHGRAGRVKTYQTLKKCGYTGRILFVLDDEDTQIEDYKRLYGKENCIVFNKAEIAARFDQMDNYSENRTIFYARNACFDIAERMNVRYFLELDDDYVNLAWRAISGKKLKTKTFQNADCLFDAMIRFLETSGAASVAFAQGGDLIGGADTYRKHKGTIKRKAMNSFFLKTDRRFPFVGRVNEDVNTYCLLGTRGNLFMTIYDAHIVQERTQQRKGGMTEQYLESGTYLKSFYTVMCCPSCVKISIIRGKKSRIHHKISWKNCTPKIISEKYKKSVDKIE